MPKGSPAAQLRPMRRRRAHTGNDPKRRVGCACWGFASQLRVPPPPPRRTARDTSRLSSRSRRGSARAPSDTSVRVSYDSAPAARESKQSAGRAAGATAPSLSSQLAGANLSLQL